MADLEEATALLEGLVRGGKTVQEAVKQLQRFTPDTELWRRAQALFEERAGIIRTLRDARGIVGDVPQPWYLGPREGDRFWPLLRQHLTDRKWDRKAIDSLDGASTRIVSLLREPGSERIDTRGLVVGYVQSGKTANFTAVISKAADAGYRFFVVLSGIHNALRKQTQQRLDRELFSLARAEWLPLTDAAGDFRLGTVRPEGALVQHGHQSLLCVVKKNATVLRRLLRWMRNIPPELLARCPTLVIDDEADQASINTSVDQNARTAINRLILEILSFLPKAAYIGYTATPFANVLIDPTVTDLYPKDFILSLPRPPEYFGPERIFGRERLDLDDPGAEFDGLDMIRLVENAEVALLRPTPNKQDTFSPQMTPSLKKALHWFCMVSAARLARGQRAAHSSMLVHTTLYAAVHERFVTPIKTVFQQIKQALTDHAVDELRAQWEAECELVPATTFGLTPTPFEEVLAHLPEVLQRIDVVVENSRSDIRLEYPENPTVGRIVVVVGGNTLSRGLTIEGLSVSLFVRAATAYDTLLQMGRWFGYRNGYADLPRIWMTRELEGWFGDLATVEQEVRNDILRYEQERVTPLDFGVRIRQHPALDITARVKMGRAMPCQMSFDDVVRETILFRHRDQAWLRGNLDATRAFLQRARATVGAPREDEAERWRRVFFGVPTEEVLTFLEQYAFHESARDVRRDMLTGYIRAQNKLGELLQWNVALIGLQRPEGHTTLDLGAGLIAPTLNRSRVVRGLQPEDTASLARIISKVDLGADLDFTRSELSAMTEESIRLARRNSLARVGLLCVYPIDKASAPERPRVPSASAGGRERAPLDAVEHLVGLGFVFPKSGRPTPQDYVTVDLSGVDREAVPEADEEPEEGVA